MKTRLFVIVSLIFLLVAVSISWAQENLHSEAVVKNYFFTKEFPEKKSYLTGEHLQYYGDLPHLGSNMKLGINGKIKLLKLEVLRAIYSVSITKDSHTQDMYCYMKNENGKWKIEAIRALALPGFFWMYLDSLQNKIQLSGLEKDVFENMKLTALSDSALCQYFLRHESRFVDLLNKMREVPSGVMFGDGLKDEEQKRHDTVGIMESVKALYLNYTGKSDEFEGVYDFNIGGMIDNSVGYFYCLDHNKLPKMSPDRFILILHIKGHWYLYKTT